MARWLGQVRFCLLPYARIVGIIWLARTAVKAERSEFISSLEGGRSHPMLSIQTIQAELDV
jgi:hypothetical protein